MMSDTSARANRFARRLGSLFRKGLIGRRPADGAPAVAPCGAGPFTCSATAGLLVADGVAARGAGLAGPDQGIAPEAENSPVRAIVRARSPVGATYDGCGCAGGA